MPGRMFMELVVGSPWCAHLLQRRVGFWRNTSPRRRKIDVQLSTYRVSMMRWCRTAPRSSSACTRSKRSSCVSSNSFVTFCRTGAPQACDAIARLALITRYSQERLPVEAFLMLLGLDVRRERFSRRRFARRGRGEARHVRRHAHRYSHPLLAEEILRRHLSPAQADLENAWRVNLTAFCIQISSRR